ncbi:MAG TPA: hypothetical protein VF120_04695 [Ktedonobacterales bacterium]
MTLRILPEAGQPIPPENRQKRQGHTYQSVMIFLAFLAFLLTGFGAGLGVWQPIPVYLFLCLALLTLQEHIAQNRSLAHRTYTFLAGSLAVLYAGEVAFAVKPLDFTHVPIIYVTAEIVLLAVFAGDTVARHRQRAGLSLEPSQTATPSARFGDWAIDMAGIAVFFYMTAFLLDLLG